MPIKCFRLVGAILALALAALPAQGQSQDFPVRMVRLITPFAAGGGVDIVARLVASKLSEAWGQSVIVEDKPGASGAIATEYVAHQPADGYTMMLGVIGTHAIAQYLNPKLSYDPVRDFAGVTLLVRSPLICLVAPSAPFHAMKELADYAKIRPVSFGSPGAGSTPHLVGEMFNLLYGTQFEHVAYRGLAPAQQDLIGGHIAVVFGELGSAKPFLTSGQLRGLAVTGTARSPSLPDVPTFAEAGYPGFDATNSWFALFVPAATPKPIVDRIAEEATRILRSPDMSARLMTDGWQAGGGTPEEFTKYWLETSKRLGHVIQERHIRVE